MVSYSNPIQFMFDEGSINFMTDSSLWSKPGGNSSLAELDLSFVPKCAKMKRNNRNILSLIQDFTLEQQKTKVLMDEIDKLRREKDQLRSLLENHAFTCSHSDTGTPNTTPGYEQATTFDFPATSVPFPQNTRDTSTPFQEDPFDHIPVMPNDSYLYPQFTNMKPEIQPGCAVSAAAAALLPELNLADVSRCVFYCASCIDLMHILHKEISDRFCVKKLVLYLLFKQ